ncbi:MAG: hybrid sensor histidine kinase/response regulator [Planctomycetota bacterium]
MSSIDENSIPSLDAISQLIQEGRCVAPELQEIFGEEAEDHLRSIYDGLDQLQTDVSNQAAIAEIRRASHTLKGAAGAVGVSAVTRLAHRMEDLLDDLADNGRPATSEITLLLLSTADRIQELTGDDFDVTKMAGQIIELYEQYQVLCPSAGQDAPASMDDGAVPSEFEDDFDEDDAELAAALANFGGDLDDELAETMVDEEQANVQSATTALSTESASEPAAERTESSEVQERASKSEAHIRVPLSRLDELVRLVGEMIINRSEFAQRLADFTDQIDDMQMALHRLRGVTDEVETKYSVEALNQMDGSGTFRRDRFVSSRWQRSSIHDSDFDSLEFDRYNDFHLLARTLSEATGDIASISHECRALSGDFDTLLNRWQRVTRDAQSRLMHIRMVPLRTIVPRLGRSVRSTAAQCQKLVNFVVRGDHTELDKTVLEEIADPLLHLVRNSVDHGIESTEQRAALGKPETGTLTIHAVNQGTQLTIRVEDDGGGLDTQRIRARAIERGLISAEQSLSEREIQQLIFAPGFSTAESVSDVSGRGVGMDVVRETVARLKGIIRIESEVGRGTRFTIILPTSLAVTRALFVESAGALFALPMQAVKQISRSEPSKTSFIGEDPMIEVAGRTLRLANLSEKLGLGPGPDHSNPSPMLVIESGDRSVAVTVDDIHGGHDIVVKSLGDHLRTVPGVIGATVRGDGSVIPILDPADLVGFCREATPVSLDRVAAKRVGIEQRRHVLVVDDSVSVRRITSSVMRSGGWSVTTAKDGVDAIEQLDVAEQLPSVILLDMEMPRMNGLELLVNLRASEEYSAIPVVMVTSRAGAKHRERAMEAGATEYIVKPFREDQLLALASRLADHSTAMAETV